MPRMSISKMAEYMVASTSRRHRILREQFRPRTFVVDWYRELTPVAVKFFVTGDADIIERAMNEWLSTVPEGAHHEQQLGLWLEVAPLLVDAYDALDVDDLTIEPAPTKGVAKCVVGGLEISVRPELYVSDKSGKRGAWKLYFGKSFPMTSRSGGSYGSGDYAAGILRQWTEEHRSDGERTLCTVIDVVQGVTFVPPKATKRMDTQIAAAAKDIELLWGRV